jgi:hypothetical protein
LHSSTGRAVSTQQVRSYRAQQKQKPLLQIRPSPHSLSQLFCPEHCEDTDSDSTSSRLSAVLDLTQRPHLDLVQGSQARLDFTDAAERRRPVVAHEAAGSKHLRPRYLSPKNHLDVARCQLLHMSERMSCTCILSRAAAHMTV